MSFFPIKSDLFIFKEYGFTCISGWKFPLLKPCHVFIFVFVLILNAHKYKNIKKSDRPGMTLDVYRGRKTTIQQQQQPKD